MFDNPGLTSGAPAMRLGASMSPVSVEGSGADGPGPADARFLTSRAMASSAAASVVGAPSGSPLVTGDANPHHSTAVAIAEANSARLCIGRAPRRDGRSAMELSLVVHRATCTVRP